MAKIELNAKLTAEQVKELAKVVQDVFYFSLYIYVVHPVRGKVPFLLYPYQKKVLYQFVKDRFNIILKFRQAGITELISMYCLWLAMYHPNKKINIISIKDSTAKKVLKKIKYMYKNLPPYLQVPIVNGRAGEYGSASMIEFNNGSFIESIPTSSEAGRSESLSLLVIDEAAIVRWASQIWAAAFPTLSTGGSAIVNSTPYGIGNFYHSKWVDAIAGGNEFTPIRLYWQMHPERDINWYNQMSTALGPKRTAQEIDGDFLSSGNSVFDLMDIKAIEDCLSEFPIIKRRYNGQYLQFNEAELDQQYFIGADVATGRATDYSSFTCMTKDGEEVAVYKGRMSVDKYARLLGDTGQLFNWATIAPESNDVGLAVTSMLQAEAYPKLYYYQKMVKKKGKSQPEVNTAPGWLTTSKNRTVIIDGLEADIRNDVITCKDPFFVYEAKTFIYDSLGRPVAMGKHKANREGDDSLSEDTYADDDIMGKAICNHIRKGKQNIIIQPR
ncbi:MAG: hypothetical protein NC131_06180 [Roseburia sp.]|nr:hypothetical protein [Roseburia sp.]